MLPDSKDDGDQTGITDPPPEIKTIVDKIAKFMASVHPRIEKSIIKDIGGKPESTFLNAADAHNAYYKHRVSEFCALNESADGNDSTGYYLSKENFCEPRTGKRKATTSEWEAELLKRHERDMEMLRAAPTVVSPITGEPVPAFAMSEHLQDTECKEQKERLFAKIREKSTLADDERIITTIDLFAERRPGVLGANEDEFCKQVKEEIDRFSLRPATEVVSLFTGQAISVNEICQHMQDPMYKEEKEKWFAKVRDATLAQDGQIYVIIDWLARTHPDLLGPSAEEFFNAVKAKIESANQKLEQLHNSLFPNMSYDSTPPVTPPGSPPPQPPPPTSSEEAEPKRQRLDGSLPVPEDEFLAQYPGPARISVAVPGKAKMLDISVESLSESVSSFKDKIAREIDVPANKMLLELISMPGPFEDNLSLAYYNVAGGDMLFLSW